MPDRTRAVGLAFQALSACACVLIVTMVVIVLGTCERIFVALHTEGSFGKAIDFVVANASSRHFLGLVLLLSLVVGPYLTFQEIEDALGKGKLFRLLLERPMDKPDRREVLDA